MVICLFVNVGCGFVYVCLLCCFVIASLDVGFVLFSLIVLCISYFIMHVFNLFDLFA